MQGPGTEKEARISFILLLSILAFSIMLAFSTGCDCKKSKKKTSNVYNYSKGDVVYLKPDSTVASISDTRISIDGITGRYEANYKDNSGNIQMVVIEENQIYGKK